MFLLIDNIFLFVPFKVERAHRIPFNSLYL
jgi:hypothetical protein